MQQTRLLEGCARCAALPEEAAGPGRLLLWFPVPHVRGEVVRLLDGLGLEHRALPGGAGGAGLAVGVAGERMQEVARAVAERLGPEEVADTRVLWVHGAGEPGLADFPRVTSLRRFVAAGHAGWLADLLREERVTSHFQPIVETADTSALFAYEALLRGFDEHAAPVSPDRIFAAARDSDLLFQVDLAARQSAIREAVRQGIAARIFINFTPASIYDPAYCLRSTVAAIAESGLAAHGIVFEVIESERVDDVGHLESILAVYRRAGFQVALDDLGAGYSSLTLMSRLRPDFVKLDRELIRQVDQDVYKAVIAQKLLEIARELGIRTIAEGVETADELAWLRRHGADYVQGYLIGRPAAEPARSIPRL